MANTSTGKNRAHNEGSIYKRSDGTWCSCIMIGYNDKGKPKKKFFYARTKTEAKAKLDQFKKEHIMNQGVVVQKSTLTDFLMTWLTGVKRHELKPKSYDRIEQTINLYIIPNIGFMQIQAVDSDTIQSLINQLIDRGLSYSTVKKVYDVLNASFKNAILRRNVVFNPCAGVALPQRKKAAKAELRFYTEDEAYRIAASATSVYSNGRRKYRIGDAYILLLNTGLRVGELCALKWEHVDLESRLLYVCSNRVVIKNRTSNDTKYVTIDQDSTKTDSGERTIPLNDSAYNALISLNDITISSGYVVASSNGIPYAQANIDHTFRRILKDANLYETKNYGVHSLRHTFATTMLNNGVDIKVVSMLLGHADVNITYNTYIHVIDSQKVKAVAALPNIV